MPKTPGMVVQQCAVGLVRIRQDGTRLAFAAPPLRIVTMLPSLTEIVWVLGAGPRLVGVDRYSNWPEPVAALPHLGGMEDAQIEAIAALKPASLINIFRLGIAQLAFLKTPEHAAVNTCVELAEAEGIAHQKPLVNAIMRRLTREGFPEMSARDAGKFNTPAWLWDQ